MKRVLFVLVCALALGVSLSAEAQSYRGVGNCNKGIFWPFSREPGDCLTKSEIERGQTGTFGNPDGALTGDAPRGVASNTGRGLLDDDLAAASGVAASGTGFITRTQPDGTTCSKGFWWPFVRSEGDCLTDAEQENAAEQAAAQ